MSASAPSGLRRCRWTCPFFTRWLESRRLAFANVRLWHIADIDAALSMSAFGGKADIPDPRSNVRLRPKADIPPDALNGEVSIALV